MKKVKFEQSLQGAGAVIRADPREQPEQRAQVRGMPRLTEEQ